MAKSKLPPNKWLTQKTRLLALVTAANESGRLRLDCCGSDGHRWTQDISAEAVPARLRRTGKYFIALSLDGSFLQFDPDGTVWFESREKVRRILNRFWDPFGVAGVVENEYDGYVGELHMMILRHAAVGEIENRLLRIEIDLMSLPPKSKTRRLDAARRLSRLRLPELTGEWRAA